MNKPHISPSQVRMLDFCEQQWYFRYRLGQKTPPGFVLIEGSGAHKAAEVNNVQKVSSGEDLPVDTLVEAAVAEVEKRVMDEGIELSTEDEKAKGRAAVIGSIKDSLAYRLVPLYHADIAPKIQPEHVESKVVIELPNHSHDLMGIMDVATVDGTVRDLKVTGRSKSQSEADTSMQLTWYHVAYEHLTGKPPAAVGLDVLVKTKVPKTQWLTSYRDENDIDFMLKRINLAIQKIEAIDRGTVEPKPAAMGSPMCSAKMCGYFWSCPWTNKTRKAASEDVE